MPTKRTRIGRRHRADIAPEVLALLRDEPLPEGGNRFRYQHTPAAALRKIWGEIGAEILAEWVETSPGTRPCMWWRCDAPEPRLRLGGRATSAGEECSLGMPISWIGDFFIDHGDFAGERFDPSAPPTFESQAAYLKRNGLLLEREGARLTAADFLPEPLPAAFFPSL